MWLPNLYVFHVPTFVAATTTVAIHYNMAPRRRDPNSPLWKIKTCSKRSPQTERLMTSEEKAKLALLIEEKYGFAPRPFQLEGICSQIERVDTIVQAPTGAGKTTIAAGIHLWPDGKQKVTIMVSPLLALEDEMVRCQNQHGWTS